MVQGHEIITDVINVIKDFCPKYSNISSKLASFLSFTIISQKLKGFTPFNERYKGRESLTHRLVESIKTPLKILTPNE